MAGAAYAEASYFTRGHWNGSEAAGFLHGHTAPPARTEKEALLKRGWAAEEYDF